MINTKEQLQMELLEATKSKTILAALNTLQMYPEWKLIINELYFNKYLSKYVDNIIGEDRLSAMTQIEGVASFRYYLLQLQKECEVSIDSADAAQAELTTLEENYDN